MIIEIINDINTHLTIDLFNPHTSGFIVSSIDGLGAPVADINMDARATGDGSRYNSSRREGRNIVFNLLFDENTRRIEDTRRVCYRIFPVGHKVHLTFRTNNRVCTTSGYVETNTPNIFSDKEGAQISILCENAYFNAEGDELFDFSGVTNNFEFPFDNNSLSQNLIEFSTLYKLFEANVFNDGDADTGFVMRIKFKETVSNLVVTNKSSLKKRWYTYSDGGTPVIEYDLVPTSVSFFPDMTGYSFNSGCELVYISLPNQKNCWAYNYNGATWNLLAYIEGDWLRLIRGDNIIEVTGTGLNESEISITYPLQYAGV